MPIDETTLATSVATGTKIAEALQPELIPFDPLILLVENAIMRHFINTNTWPTSAEVQAALPANYRALADGWAAWTPSGDGTLKTAPPAGV